MYGHPTSAVFPYALLALVSLHFVLHRTCIMSIVPWFQGRDRPSMDKDASGAAREPRIIYTYISKHPCLGMNKHSV